MKRIIECGLAVLLCAATVGEAQQVNDTVVVLDAEKEALVETRTPLNPPGEGEMLPAAASIEINAPGSYVLTGNVIGVAGKHGIEINKSNVTIDLNGFALVGKPDALSGIHAESGVVNVTIINGAIRGWPQHGISGTKMTSSAVSNVRIGNCGQDGIRLGHGVVSGCTARQNGQDGIRLTKGKGVVRDCAAELNGQNGVRTGNAAAIMAVTAAGNAENGILGGRGSTIADCAATENGIDGVYLDVIGTVRGVTASFNERNGIAGGGAVADSTATANAQNGIDINAGSITNCFAETNSQHGINTGNGVSVIGCSASLNGDMGIVTGNSSSVLDCTVRKNDVGGIRVISGCRVMRCVANEHGGIDKFAIQTTTNCTVAENSIWVATVGIHALGSINRIQDNSISAATGVLLDDTNCIVVRNSFSTTVTPIDSSGINRIGSISVNPDTAGAWQNLGY